MGLNLPVRQVILYDLQEYNGGDFRPLAVNCVWQRAGRAGRPGLDDSGEVVLLAAAWDRDANRYAGGRFEPIRSALSERRNLAEQIVVEVASGLTRTEAQLTRLFQTSLAARQKTLPPVSGLIGEMVEAGMLCRGQDTFHATRLGHIACRHFLNPATVLLFRRVLEGPHDLTFLDILLTAAASEDCEPILPADFEELDDLATRLSQEPSALLGLPRRVLAGLLGVDGKWMLAAVKMALVSRDWTRTGDVEGVAERVGCYPFELKRLCESLTRLLLAMGALAEPEAASGEGQVPVRERIAVLGKMIAHGLDEEAATLTLVDGIGGTMAARLKEAGIADVEALAQAEVDQLKGIKGLSESRARRWIEEATEIVRGSSAFRYRESARRRDGGSTARDRRRGVEPYRLRRALDLTVLAQDSGVYRVAGGLEPHLVQMKDGQLVCDCAEAAQGHICKHALAVRLHRDDHDLQRLLREQRAEAEDAPIDLFSLWFER
jgi:helicase